MLKAEEMCMESLKNIEEKQNYYLNTLESSLTPNSRRFGSPRGTDKYSPYTWDRTLPLKRLQDFSDYEFLQESNNYQISATKREKLRSMPVDHLKKILEKGFHLFLESHTNQIRSLTLIIDEKYIISAMDDKTIRICTFPIKTRMHIAGPQCNYH